MRDLEPALRLGRMGALQLLHRAFGLLHGTDALRRVGELPFGLVCLLPPG
jgi:hypothetical protein